MGTTQEVYEQEIGKAPKLGRVCRAETVCRKAYCAIRGIVANSLSLSFELTNFKVFDVHPNLTDYSGRFVAEDHGLCDNERTNGSVREVVHIRAADADATNGHLNFCKAEDLPR